MPSVELESLTTKSRFVSIVATDIDGEGQVNGTAHAAEVILEWTE